MWVGRRAKKLHPKSSEIQRSPAKDNIKWSIREQKNGTNPSFSRWEDPMSLLRPQTPHGETKREPYARRAFGKNLKTLIKNPKTLVKNPKNPIENPKP